MMYKSNIWLLVTIFFSWHWSCHSRIRRDCGYTFNVWEPETDMVLRMHDIEIKYANFSNYIDKELLKMQVQASHEIRQNQNLTRNLELSLMEIKIEHLNKLTEVKSIENTVARYELKLREFEDRFNDFVVQYNSIKTHRRKHVRNDRMIPSRGSQADNPGNFGSETLKNMVADLKSEWILMKRDIIEIRAESSKLTQDQKKLYNDSIDLKKTSDFIQTTCLSMESNDLKNTNDFVNFKSNIESIKQDLYGLKSTQQTLRNDVLVAGNGVYALQASAVDMQREISSLKTDNENLKKKLSISNTGQSLNLPISDPAYRLKLQPTYVAKDCHDIVSQGHSVSGVYQIQPDITMPLDNIYCEIINGTGYTVIQRRTDGLLDFNRGWLQYKIGFGNMYGEFWAGNEFLHALTKNNDFSLRVDLWDWEGNRSYAEYNIFAVGDEASQYTLHVNGFLGGNAGDSLTSHDGMKFSTKDLDNDEHNRRNCAAASKGGWWYKSCYESQLNSVYHVGWYSQTPSTDGIVWYSLKNSERYSVRRAEMKLRRNV